MDGMEEEVVPLRASNKRKRDEVGIEDYRSIGIIYDDHLNKESDKHPRLKGRFHAVFGLIRSYDLLGYFTVLKPNRASFEDLCDFHSRDYIEYLQKINTDYTPEDEVDFEFGLGYDCPSIDGIYDFCCSVGGTTLTAARALILGTVDIVINWYGGWHHAQRDEAEGFCYINDICLGILELRRAYENILYLDLDIHHGNGVENAFANSKRILTASFHLLEPGFYPGTGTLDDVGFGNGKYYAVNVPLRSGVSDSTYIEIFDWLLNAILRKFEPDAIVVQCGVDGLSGDPIGRSFNLSEKAYGHCLKRIVDLKKPLLIVGGGGYDVPNTARCWTYLTSIIAGVHLSSDIPEHEYFPLYRSSFELPVNTSLRKDCNSLEYLEKLKAKISSNLENICTE